MKVQCYPRNSVRLETEDDVCRYAIYINDELYELCPLQATRQECEMRLHDIMNELWIEWWTEPRFKEIKD